MKIPLFAILAASTISLPACCQNTRDKPDFGWDGVVGDAVSAFRKTNGRLPKNADELNPFIDSCKGNRYMPPLQSAYSHTAPNGVTWVRFETRPDPGECHGYEGTVGLVDK